MAHSVVSVHRGRSHPATRDAMCSLLTSAPLRCTQYSVTSRAKRNSSSVIISAREYASKSEVRTCNIKFRLSVSVNEGILHMEDKSTKIPLKMFLGSITRLLATLPSRIQTVQQLLSFFDNTMPVITANKIRDF